MLSTAAWNAFLKTLEEPPPNTVFVLATTEAQKVPADGRRPLPPLRLPAPDASSRSRPCSTASRSAESIDDRPGGGRRARPPRRRQLPRRARHARAAADLRGLGEIALADVLAVLGISDAELLFDALDAIAAGDPRGALERGRRGASTAATTRRAFIRELEAHARELLIVQMLGRRRAGRAER